MSTPTMQRESGLWVYDSTAWMRNYDYLTNIPPAAPIWRMLQASVSGAPLGGGGGGQTPQDVRNALVPTTYIPGPTTTGPVDGTVFTVVGSSTTSVTVSAKKDFDVIENMYIWGDVNLASWANVTVQNCIIRGSLQRGPSEKSHIQSSGDDMRGAIVQDCLILGRPVLVPATYNGSPVDDAGYLSVSNEWRSNGTRGGRYTVRRCEMTRIVDAVGLTSQLGQVTVEANWFHGGAFNEWTSHDGVGPYSSGSTTLQGIAYYIDAAGTSTYTHGDGIQFHRGKDYLIRGNLIGGTRTGIYDHNKGFRTQILAGDDWYNTCILMNQEVSQNPIDRIERVVIEKNWLQGAVSTENIVSRDPGAVGSDGKYNTFSDLFFRDNIFPYSIPGQVYMLNGPGLGNFSNNKHPDGVSVAISRGF